MIAPLSWLKEYVDITLSPKELGERLTEVGLGTERISKADDDTIFEFEITPNRPDLLSIIGIAREIAAIEKKTIKLPKLPNISKPQKSLSLTINADYKINPRFTGIIIDRITVKESPVWLKKRLQKVGLRPINNIVDITNYVMLELGNPLHAFDYEKIKGSVLNVTQTNGGEEFKSVDSVTYHLPKDAVVIKDSEKIIDLCGIKGGFNSQISNETKTIFIRVPIEVPTFIRKTSQALGLRSEASAIFERGVNSGGTIETLRRCVDLVLKLAGGEIASNLYDLKKSDFSPWKLELRLDRLAKILGVNIPEKNVLSILDSLNLSPKKIADKNLIETIIPTYRNDLKIEEDLIEEVARLYGYNKFPKALPLGQIPIKQIPYFKDYKLEEKVKNIFTSCGFSEIYTYSLLSENDIADAGFDPENILRIDNPISRDFEYLRSTLKIGLKKALIQNKPNFEKINLFELGKAYLGKSLDNAEEAYFLSGISNSKTFFEIKGLLEELFDQLGITDDPSGLIQSEDDTIVFELNFSKLLEKINLNRTFVPIPKYPPVFEDLSLIIDKRIAIGELIKTIKEQSEKIINVSLLSQFEKTKTFHIVYQDKNGNLSNEDVSKIREKILKTLKSKFGATQKE
ncbi:MAG: phenylalanine--tRNA ligase subunit beta [Candidatus Levybacteria bacterium]|nr:phenylalanine--tRNA ligase subunit beta [Candidatus Levybacteria bacterium]